MFNNLEQVSDEIQKRVSARLVKTPLMCKHIGLGKVKPPDLIIAAQESAKKRQIEEDTAKAEKDVQLTLADGRLNVELLEQEIHLVEAETQVMSDLILSDSVSEAFIAQRALRAWQGLVNNPNATFVIPMRVFHDPKTLIGLSDEAVHRFNIDAETKARLDAVLKDIEAIKATEREKMQKSSEESKKSDK